MVELTDSKEQKDVVAEADAKEPAEPSHPILETKRPGGVVGFNNSCLPKGLTTSDYSTESVLEGINICSTAISKYEYHMYGATFNVDKKRAIQKLFATADQILKEGVMIQCVEACFVALLLTDKLLPVTRFAISFESKCEDKTFRHLVLGLRYEGKFGTLGISRNSGLMTKAMTFESLKDIVDDFIKYYKKDGHTVTGVTLSKPIPHESPNTVVHWNYFSLQLQVGDPETHQLELERYTTRTLDSQIPFTSQFSRTKSLTQTHAKPSPTRGRLSSQSPVATKRGLSANRFRPGGASPSPARRPISQKTTPTARTPTTKVTKRAPSPSKDQSDNVSKVLFQEESDRSPAQDNKFAKGTSTPSQKEPQKNAASPNEVGTEPTPTESIPPPKLVPPPAGEQKPSTLLSPVDDKVNNSSEPDSSQDIKQTTTTTDTKRVDIKKECDKEIAIPLPVSSPPSPSDHTKDQTKTNTSNQLPQKEVPNEIDIKQPPTSNGSNDDKQQPVTQTNKQAVQPTPKTEGDSSEVGVKNEMSPSSSSSNKKESQTTQPIVRKTEAEDAPVAQTLQKSTKQQPQPQKESPKTGLPAWNSCTRVDKSKVKRSSGDEIISPARNAKEESIPNKVNTKVGSSPPKQSKSRGRSNLMGPFATPRKVSPKPPTANTSTNEVSTPFAPDFDSENDTKTTTTTTPTPTPTTPTAAPQSTPNREVVSFSSPKPENRNHQLLDQIIVSPTKVCHQDPLLNSEDTVPVPVPVPVPAPAGSPVRSINLNTAVKKETSNQVDIPVIDPSLVESFRSARRIAPLSPPERSTGVNSESLTVSLPKTSIAVPTKKEQQQQQQQQLVDDDIPAIDPSLVASFKSAHGLKADIKPTAQSPRNSDLQKKTHPSSPQKGPPKNTKKEASKPIVGGYKKQLQNPLDGYAPLHLPPPSTTIYQTAADCEIGKPQLVPMVKKVTKKPTITITNNKQVAPPPPPPQQQPSQPSQQTIILLKRCVAEEEVARRALEDLENSGRQFKSSVMRAERESRQLLGNGGRNDVESAAAMLWKNVKTKREFKKESDYTRDQIASYLSSELVIYKNKIQRQDPLLEYLSTVETPLLTLEAALPHLTTSIADGSIVRCQSSWGSQKGCPIQKRTFLHEKSTNTSHSIGWYCTSLAKRWLRSPPAVELEPTAGSAHCEHEIILNRPARVKSLAVISSAVAVQISADCGTGYVIHRSSNICESCIDNGNYDEVQLSLLHIDLSNQPQLSRIKLLLLPHRKSADAVFPLTYQSTHVFVEN